MSALDFQKVMANLIRFPKATLAEVEASFQGLTLTAKERGQLEQMENDPLVRKFGVKMQYCRQRDATEVMQLSKRFLDEESLTKMYRDRFDPTRTSSDFVMLGVQFLEFALNDPDCREILARGEPFLHDLITYDYAKAYIERQVLRYNDPDLPPGSHLVHKAFLIVDLNHDIPSYAREIAKNPGSDVLPKPKAIKLIFLRWPEPPFYRMFEIDRSVEDFLLVQRDTPDRWQAPLPPAYAGMTKVGLCRPLEAPAPTP